MNDADAVDLLEELVRTRSPSGAERAAAELLVRRMDALGFEARVDEVGNAVGSVGDPGAPELVLLGHVDTVPGEVPVRREGGRLSGRGTVDAKGPLVAFVAAASRAARAGRLAARVTVIGCVEEEVASSRGAHHAARRPAPAACIVGEPSRWDRVTLGYKGYLRARLERAVDGGHGAHDRSSAAELACRTWTSIEAAARAHDGDRTELFERLLTRLDAVEATSDGLRERARLDLVLRLPPDLPPAAAERWLAAAAPGWDVAAEGGLPAWSGPRTTPLHRALARQIARAGGRPGYVRKTGTADLNVVAPAWGCPCLAYGPGDSRLDHTPDEHVELAEFLRGVDVLTGLLSNRAWCGREGSAPAPRSTDAARRASAPHSPAPARAEGAEVR